MINRRTTLLALMGAGLSHAALGRAPGTDTVMPPLPVAGTAADRALQEDLARMGAHEYSDEGIPMFLACVDVVAEKAGRAGAPPAALSQSVAADIRRYGDAWLKQHPEAPATDISKVLEVLAERDFAHGGTGEKR